MNLNHLSFFFGISMMLVCGTGCASGNNLTDSPEEGYESPALADAEAEGSAAEDTQDSFTGASPVAPDMEIVFEDDFNGVDGVPDPDKWVLCKRSASNWARYLSESYDQAYTSGGSLFLIGEKSADGYLTGGIESRGKFEFEHGVVECRARFKSMPKGGHTGIWMMPAPPALQWPKSGEIDIMEHLNSNDIVYQTVHSWYADDMGHKEDPLCQTKADINKEDWNIYGLRWTDDKIIFTVNGQTTLSYPNLHLEGENGDYQWPFNHPFYLILSQSLGGEGTWAGPIDDAELPAIFEIDWIRVTQAKDTVPASVPSIRAD